MRPDEVPQYVMEAWKGGGLSRTIRERIADVLTVWIEGPPCPPDVMAALGGNGVMYTRDASGDGFWSPDGTFYIWRNLHDMPDLTLLVERQAETPTPEADPLADIEVGDPDPTAGAYPHCGVRITVDSGARFGCTRKRGHGGQHVAGTGREVVAVWCAQ